MLIPLSKRRESSMFAPAACVFDEALAMLGVMLVLLADDGAVVWASAAARNLLSGDAERAVLWALRQMAESLAIHPSDRASTPVMAELCGPEGSYRVTAARLTEVAAGDATVAALLEPMPTLRFDHEELESRFALTHQQARVAKLLIEGHNNASIATKLGVKLSTARSHVEQVRRKLGARTRGQVVARLVSESARLTLRISTRG